MVAPEELIKCCTDLGFPAKSNRNLISYYCFIQYAETIKVDKHKAPFATRSDFYDRHLTASSVI